MRASDPLELELQAVEGAGTELGSSGRVASAPNTDPSLQPPAYCLFKFPYFQIATNACPARQVLKIQDACSEQTRSAAQV